MLPVNSVLPGSFSHPMLPKSILSPMHFPNSLPSILVSSQKKISFGLLSFATRSSSFGETLLLYQHLRLPCPPNPHPPNGKNSFLGCFALFQSSFSIHYHYSILRSSFFVLLFLGISKTDPYPLLPSPCRTVFHSCVRACGWRYGLVWVQTVWINRLLTFFLLHPYYIICILLAIVCTSSSCRPFLV